MEHQRSGLASDIIKQAHREMQQMQVEALKGVSRQFPANIAELRQFVKDEAVPMHVQNLVYSPRVFAHDDCFPDHVGVGICICFGHAQESHDIERSINQLRVGVDTYDIFNQLVLFDELDLVPH